MITGIIVSIIVCVITGIVVGLIVCVVICLIIGVIVCLVICIVAGIIVIVCLIVCVIICFIVSVVVCLVICLIACVVVRAVIGNIFGVLICVIGVRLDCNHVYVAFYPTISVFVDSDIATFSPLFTPRILDNPVSLFGKTDQKDCMVDRWVKGTP